MAALSGCGFFGNGATSTTGSTPVGFTSPTLEVTINGTRFGPAAPDASSSAQLVDQYDSTSNTLVTSTLTLNASIASLGVSCSTSIERVGSTLGTSAISAGAYQIADDLTGQTADGAVDVQSAPTVAASGSIVSCAGSTCDGFAISLSALDATVAEGYLSGNLTDGQGDAASVVCSFYLPVTVYQP